MTQVESKWGGLGLLALSLTLLLTLSLNALGCGEAEIPTGPCPANQVLVDGQCISFVDRCGLTPLSQDNIACGDGLCRVGAGTYFGPVAFVAENTYVLEGRVFIGGGTDDCAARLTIAPGTRILANPRRLGYLAVLPGSTIEAVGTATQAIVFAPGTGRSSDPDVTPPPAPGDWGGIILSGRARVSCPRPAPLEGDETFGPVCRGVGRTGSYGGDADDESSGRLRYVRIEHAGAALPERLAGLTLQAVGSGTEIDQVHVVRSATVGIAVLGGAVDLRRVIATGNAGAGLSWAQGWRGRLQFGIVQSPPDDGRGGVPSGPALLGKNRSGDPDAEPRSTPAIANVTAVSTASTSSTTGILLSAGTGARIFNSLVVGFGGGGFDIDDDATFRYALEGPDHLFVRGSSFFGSTPNFVDEPEDLRFNPSRLVLDGARFGSFDNSVADPELFPAAMSLEAPSFIPASTATGDGVDVPNDDFFLADETFRGAVSPRTRPGEAWYVWTLFF